MRKLTLFVLSLLGIAALTQCGQKQQTPQVTFNPSQTAGGKVVYVNLDTLLEKYTRYKDMKSQLEGDYKKAEGAMAGKMQGFQKRMGDFQRRVMETQEKAQELSPNQLKDLEAKFGAEQQQLANEEAALAKQRDAALGEMNQKINDLQKEFNGKIDGYLEKLAAERGYDYVLIKSAVGGSVLYGNKQLDITNEAIQALNDAYAAEKK